MIEILKKLVRARPDKAMYYMVEFTIHPPTGKDYQAFAERVRSRFADMYDQSGIITTNHRNLSAQYILSCTVWKKPYTKQEAVDYLLKEVAWTIRSHIEEPFEIHYNVFRLDTELCESGAVNENGLGKRLSPHPYK